MNVPILYLIQALEDLHQSSLYESASPIIILGDFNVNLLEASAERNQLAANMIDYKGYTQLIKDYTTDYLSQFDNLYINVPHLITSAGIIECYYSDHKGVYAAICIFIRPMHVYIISMIFSYFLFPIL